MPRKIRRNIKVLLYAEAARLVRLLKKRDVKLVFAESCTGGMASATLVGFAGISEHLCGSLVVYQNATKQRWLKISDTKNPVSQETAVAMAIGALKATPHADVAASITGNLGPTAVSSEVGTVFIAVALRQLDKKSSKPMVFYSKLKLDSKPFAALPESPLAAKQILRIHRQMAASHSLILMVRSLLEFTRSKGE